MDLMAHLLCLESRKLFENTLRFPFLSLLYFFSGFRRDSSGSQNSW